MSKEARGVWFGCCVAYGLYGYLEKLPHSTVVAGAIGLIIGLIPLYFVDKAFEKKGKK